MERKILSYSRDTSTGKILRRIIKDVANTIHCSTGGGGNTDQYVIIYVNKKATNSCIAR